MFFQLVFHSSLAKPKLYTLQEPATGEPTDFIKESDVEGETERILQSDLLCQLHAQFFGCGGRVRQKSLCVAIHEGDGQHQRLL